VKTAFGVCLCLALAACRTNEPAVRVPHLPPTAKDVIDAAMAMSQLPLTDASCKGFGTETTDRTVGRYLAGYLAELSSSEAQNAITTSVAPANENSQAVYVCRLMIRHSLKEDVWSWGLQFAVRQSDGVLAAGSVRCIGAG
jgi:hypothetical protein